MQSKRYFRGWYFKCCTRDKGIAFIPSFHSTIEGEYGSLQVITDNDSYNVRFSGLEYSEEPLKIKIDNCTFSRDGICLDYANGTVELQGKLTFKSLRPIEYDIMGPFKFVPFMQCRHSVYSMRHMVDGHIVVCGEEYDFQNGLGYIEGDRGFSFPDRYIWTQCIFDNGSLMLSVADVPFCGSKFTGVIGVVLLGGKEYRIATYLGAKVSHITENMVVVKQGKYKLEALLLRENAKTLHAPVRGAMDRTIHESVSCEAYYRFSYGETVLCEFVSDKAGFEFEYKTQ